MRIVNFSDWDTLLAFKDWYLSAQPGLQIPEDSVTLRTEDASTQCIFRMGQFQVELYLLDNIYGVVEHGHPGVEVIQVALAFEGYQWGEVINHIDGSGRHGGRNPPDRPPTPGSMLAFERWHPYLAPTSVAARWSGKVLGPQHEAVIKRFYPEARILDGYLY